MSRETLYFRINEYGRIPRDQVGARLCDELQRFDERLSRGKLLSVFDWSRRNYIRATSYVGVIQIPGLTVEILPKVDSAGDGADVKAPTAQRNLLYMLSVAGWLPGYERDFASLRLQSMPLLEVFIGMFARRLQRELRRGVNHDYIVEESNQVFLKGKLLIGEHIKRNSAHSEQLFVAFDRFISDTLMNQVLKAACRKLLGVVRNTANRRVLNESLLLLADVSDVAIRRHHFDQIHLNRNSERFASLLSFCRLVLADSSPTFSSGKASSFALLFPMEEVFEQFIGAYVRRHARKLGLQSSYIHLQSKGHRKWLLEKAAGGNKFELIPDLLIRQPAQPPIVIDTKWKRLKTDAESYRNNISQADLYQLFAYAHRFESAQNVLLYPRIDRVEAKHYRVPDSHPEKWLRIEFVDVSHDMLADKGRLLSELRQVLMPAGVSITAPLVA